jgi:hypothetical protein
MSVSSAQSRAAAFLRRASTREAPHTAFLHESGWCYCDLSTSRFRTQPGVHGHRISVQFMCERVLHRLLPNIALGPQKMCSAHLHSSSRCGSERFGGGGGNRWLDVLRWSERCLALREGARLGVSSIPAALTTNADIDRLGFEFDELRFDLLVVRTRIHRGALHIRGASRMGGAAQAETPGTSARTKELLSRPRARLSIQVLSRQPE